MICSKCGRPDDEGNRFCTHCGAPVVAVKLPTAFQPTERIPSHSMPASVGSPAEPVHDGMIGQTIDGKYRIDARIGAGGMGVVYRATRTMIGDTVALKVMLPEHSKAAQATERFRREARAAARLKHQNAVAIHDFGVTSGGMLYLVMEYVEGDSLRSLIQRQGPFTPSATAEILHQIAEALDEAHRDNIVHRDLKPDNIVIQMTAHGVRVKVLDFGIAKLRDLQTMDNLTQTGAILGTPHYMSPEQCLGEELDGRSDIYSLGIVLFEMLTGTIPFNAPSASAVIVQQVQQPPPSPRSINISIPMAVETVVLHTLQKQRDARPQSARELAREMIAAVNQVAPGPGARPVTPPQPPANAGRISPALPPTVQMDRMPQPPPPGGAIPLPRSFESAAPAPNSKPLIIGLSAAAALVVLSVAGYLLFFTAKSSIMSEIQKGNFVKPEGSSAYDLYLGSKSRLSSSDVTEISNDVLPKLENKGTETINNLKSETTNESEAGWSEAVRIYEWLNDLRPDKKYEARKYFSQARLDFLKKDYPKAISGFRRSTELEPSWGMAYNGLARAYFNAKEKYHAKDNYMRATQLDPTWIYPWINLGQLCYELGDYNEAENALRQASNIDPQRASIHYLLGVLYEKTNRICDARSEYQTAINNSANSLSPGFSVEAVKKKLERLEC